MKKLKIMIIAVFALVGVVAMVPTYDAYALSPRAEIQEGVNDAGGKGQTELGPRIRTVVSILMYVLGTISVIMIIIGGIRYTTSNGDASGIKGAKDTILYAVVGLIVAILSYAIVNFVLDAF